MGIGGAIIWSPILLSYKMPADVVSYTTQFLALLGAINNLIQYLIMGHIVWDYVAFSSFIAGISFLVGLKLVFHYFFALSLIQIFIDYALFCKEKKTKLDYFLFICSRNWIISCCFNLSHSLS